MWAGLSAVGNFPEQRTAYNNDSLNAPMLAVNRRLGYRPEPGFYRVKRVQ